MWTRQGQTVIVFDVGFVIGLSRACGRYSHVLSACLSTHIVRYAKSLLVWKYTFLLLLFLFIFRPYAFAFLCRKSTSFASHVLESMFVCAPNITSMTAFRLDRSCNFALLLFFYRFNFPPSTSSSSFVQIRSAVRYRYVVFFFDQAKSIQRLDTNTAKSVKKLPLNLTFLDRVGEG